MTEPSQTTLAEKSNHAGRVCQLEHFCVGDVILPFDAKDAPKATKVKCVEAMLLLDICRPFLTAADAGQILYRHQQTCLSVYEGSLLSET